jgi:hypothetical protein
VQPLHLVRREMSFNACPQVWVKGVGHRPRGATSVRNYLST